MLDAPFGGFSVFPHRQIRKIMAQSEKWKLLAIGACQSEAISYSIPFGLEYWAGESVLTMLHFLMLVTEDQ